MQLTKTIIFVWERLVRSNVFKHEHKKQDMKKKAFFIYHVITKYLFGAIVAATGAINAQNCDHHQ